jgi:hypothetical protein
MATGFARLAQQRAALAITRRSQLCQISASHAKLRARVTVQTVVDHPNVFPR